MESQPPDLDAVRRQLEAAAEAGDSDAMYNLGYLHAELKVPFDLDVAESWYQRAAHAGNSAAMRNLALLLADRKQPPDTEAARRWWNAPPSTETATP